MPRSTRLHVSPRGDDEADGSSQNPLSWSGLRQRLDAIPRENAAEPVEIRFHDGVYDADATLVLQPQHGGTVDAPTRLLAAEGARPVLSAATPIRNWKRLDHDLPGLPDAATDHLWYADLGDANFRTLYQHGEILDRARVGPLTTDPARKDESTDTLLCARPEDLRDWPDPANLELFIMPDHVWQAQYLPVASVDRESATITTSVPGTYRLVATGEQNPALHYWIENSAEGLSEPGRWMLDPRGRVYLWPKGDASQPPEGVAYPRLTELLRIEGGDDQPCAHVQVTGLTFTHGDRIPWPEHRRACQHDWQVYDWPDAMVRFRGARDVTVRNCRFIEAGATGLRMDRFAVANTVERCEFDRLGGGGVAILGDPPGGRENSHHNVVRSSRFHDIGRLWWQASGILLVQSANNLVTDNLLHDLSYCGITLISGREAAFRDKDPSDKDPSDKEPSDKEPNGKDGNLITPNTFGDSPRDWFHVIGHLTCRHNVIAHNEIHHAMTRLGDGNGIYLSGTGWGNIVEANYVHDITGWVQSGIRTDDMQWYTSIRGNVVARINGGGFILKHVNDLTDNVFVDCVRPGVLLFRRAPSWGANIKRNILVLSEIAEGQEPPNPFYGGGFMGDVNQPETDENLLWCPSNPDHAEHCLAVRREAGRDRNSRVGDPRFVDPDHDDYRLRPDSPAYVMGMRSPESWGPRSRVACEED